MAIKFNTPKPFLHVRGIEDELRQVLSAAITYEGQIDAYEKDARVYSHKITDAHYDIMVQNLQVYQRGTNKLGTDFSEHKRTFEHLVKTKYPEFLNNDWHYTGGFFYKK